MKRLINRILMVLGVLTTTIYTQAVEPDSSIVRPVVDAYMLEMGGGRLADTYLTPIKYAGWSGAVDYSRRQIAPFGHGTYVYNLDITGELFRTENPVGNATMLYGGVSATWGITRQWAPVKNLRLGFGPVLTLDAGCLYNGRNSNNPASAKGSLTLDARGTACYNFTLWRKKMTLCYEATIPVIGAFFSPHYDELYYEIYLGNRSGLVQPAWWGTRWKYDQRFTLDIPLGSSRLRVGYAGEWMSSKVKNLTTRIISNRILIGYTTEWLSVKTASKARLDNARIISAIY